MASYLLSAVTILVIVGVFGVGYFQHRVEMKELHAQAMQQFLSTSNGQTDPRLRFDGAEATIVEEKLEWARMEGSTFYFLTLYATNPAGEYFIFRTTTGQPILKHISQDVAKAILKSKFKLPSLA